MRRVPDWDERLAAEIQRARGMMFAWGSHDCCLWVARVVAEISGHDFAVNYRGYKTAAGAARLLDAHGGVAGIASRALGPAIPLAHAVRGDVVAFLGRDVDGVERDALGIVIGSRFAAVTTRGLIFPAMWTAYSAWAVGHA